MRKQDTGGSAFPLHNHGAQTLGLDVTGMTLRDYFAAKAMETLLKQHRSVQYSLLCNAAYDIADAMLKARDA
jgi:hypothetical protein